MDTTERIAVALERIAAALEMQAQCQKNQAIRTEAMQMASLGDSPLYDRYLEMVKNASNPQTP